MSSTLWNCTAFGVALSASVLGSGCSEACEVDGDCDVVECRQAEIQACLDRNREYTSVWPLGQGRPGSCATEDDCDLLTDFSGTGTGTAFGSGTDTGTGTDTGAGGSP